MNGPGSTVVGLTGIQSESLIGIPPKSLDTPTVLLGSITTEKPKSSIISTQIEGVDSILTSTGKPLRSTDFKPRDPKAPIVDIKNAEPVKQVSRWEVAGDILGNILTIGIYSVVKGMVKAHRENKAMAETAAREMREGYNALKDEAKSIGKGIRLVADIGAKVELHRVDVQSKDSTGAFKELGEIGEYVGAGEYIFGSVRIISESIYTIKDQLKAAKTIEEFNQLKGELRDLVKQLDDLANKVERQKVQLENAEKWSKGELGKPLKFMLPSLKRGLEESITSYNDLAKELGRVSQEYDRQVTVAANAIKTKDSFKEWMAENGLTLGRYVLNLLKIGFTAAGEAMKPVATVLGHVTGIYSLVAAGISFYRAYKAGDAIDVAEGKLQKAIQTIEKREREIFEKLKKDLGKEPSDREITEARHKDIALQYANAVKKAQEATISEKKAEVVSQMMQGGAYLIQGVLTLAVLIAGTAATALSGGALTPVMFALAGLGASVGVGMYISKLCNTAARQNKVADLADAYRRLEEGARVCDVERDNPQVQRVMNSKGYKRQYDIPDGHRLSKDQLKTIVARELAVHYSNLSSQEILRNLVQEIEQSGHAPPRPSLVELGKAKYEDYEIPNTPTLQMLKGLGLKAKDISELYYARSVGEGVKMLMKKTGLAEISTTKRPETQSTGGIKTTGSQSTSGSGSTSGATVILPSLTGLEKGYLTAYLTNNPSFKSLPESFKTLVASTMEKSPEVIQMVKTHGSNKRDLSQALNGPFARLLDSAVVTRDQLTSELKESLALAGEEEGVTKELLQKGVDDGVLTLRQLSNLASGNSLYIRNALTELRGALGLKEWRTATGGNAPSVAGHMGFTFEKSNGDGDCFYWSVGKTLEKGKPVEVRQEVDGAVRDFVGRYRAYQADSAVRQLIDRFEKGTELTLDDRQILRKLGGEEGKVAEFVQQYKETHPDPKTLSQSDREILQQLGGEPDRVIEELDALQKAGRLSELASGKTGESTEITRSRWGSLDLVPFIVKIYNRPVVLVQRKAVDDQQIREVPVLYGTDGSKTPLGPSDKPPKNAIVLVFNGSNHWDGATNS
jgi:hypothetical protein